MAARRRHARPAHPALAPPCRLAAACVASLPRINGDGASWSAMAQRLLTSAHALLDTLLLGLEDQGLAGTARCAPLRCALLPICSRGQCGVC